MFNVQPVIYKKIWDTMFLIMHNVASKSIEINGKSMFTVRCWQFNVRSNVPSSVKTLQFASVSASYLNSMLLRTLAFVPWAHIGCGVSYTINTFFLLYILWKYRNFASFIYIVSKGSPFISPLITYFPEHLCTFNLRHLISFNFVGAYLLFKLWILIRWCSGLTEKANFKIYPHYAQTGMRQKSYNHRIICWSG